MKFIISFIFCSNSYAALVSIYHERNLDMAKIYHQIFVTEYQIPKNLIEIKETNDCLSQKSQKKLSICLDQRDEMVMINAERSFINLTIKSFSQTK